MDKKLYDMISSVKNGDDNSFTQLCDEYASLINSSVKSFFDTCPEADKDDLRQEAIMALYSAAKSFNLEQSTVTFGLFAKICVKNRLISVSRKLKSQRKAKKLVKEESALKDGMGRQSESLLLGSISSEALLLLSSYEKRVFALYVKGCSYSDMAAELSVSLKSIDNAVYRIKSKLKKFYYI